MVLLWLNYGFALTPSTVLSLCESELCGKACENWAQTKCYSNTPLAFSHQQRISCWMALISLRIVVMSSGPRDWPPWSAAIVVRVDAIEKLWSMLPSKVLPCWLPSVCCTTDRQQTRQQVRWQLRAEPEEVDIWTVVWLPPHLGLHGAGPEFPGVEHENCSVFIYSWIRKWLDIYGLRLDFDRRRLLR